MTINETLRLVLTEGLRAYSDVVNGDAEDAKHKLRLMHGDLERFLNADNGGPSADGSHLFASDCPPGYDTVVGYLAKYHPDMLDLLADPIADTRRDGILLNRECKKLGRDVVKVDAPTIFQEEGVATLNSFPIEMLKVRFG